MNQSSIKPINGVRASEGNMLSKEPTSVQAESASQARSAAARQQKTNAEANNQLNDEIGSLANVSIHFRVDDKTDSVTMFLVDRKSKKVLRSIPTSELQKMQIADLLKLTI
jgi:uncharacterized FlaG/YvyC family protein